MIRGCLPDALLLGGAAAITTGLWWCQPWVALVVLGSLCITGGIFLERADRIRQERGAGRRTQ